MTNHLRRRRFLMGILLIFLGYNLAATEAYAKEKNSPQPVQSLAVFDAQGKRVGNVLGFVGVIAKVAYRIDGELVILNVGRQGFTGDGGGFLQNFGSFYFESVNCTGTPFDTSGGGAPSILMAPAHLLDGTKLYSYGGPPKTIIVRSQGSTSSPSWCQPLSSFQQVASPMRLLIDLADHFQPPFTLR